MNQPNQTETSPAARLVMLSGTQTGVRHIVREHATLGRALSTIVFDDPDISRLHAEISWGPEAGYVLRDKGSRNGTFLNGEQIEEHKLSFGDEISCGSLRMLFERYDPLEEAIVHRQRLETLGRLGAGVAHDFNNLLTVIQGSVEFLRDSLSSKLNAVEKECFDNVESAIERAADLTPRLMSVVRPDAEQVGRFNISAVCNEIVELIRRTFERNITIEAHIEPNLVVGGHAGDAHQVLMNLCLNARDAMRPRGGRLRIAVALDHNSAGRPQVILTVQDTGVGMDEQTLARIFEPFYSTKGDRKDATGYGIGLSVTRDLVEAAGGSLRVESKPKRGTTFSVIYAREREEAGTHPRLLIPTSERYDEKVTSNILVVDDDKLVRLVMVRTLDRAGHSTLQASDGAEAIRIYQETEPKPQLVLLDLDMPGMAGEETLRRLRQLNPALRALVVTGHTDRARSRRLVAQGALNVLRKPLPTRRLLAEVQLALRVDMETAGRQKKTLTGRGT